MRFYVRSLLHGVTRIVSIPRLSLPILITLSLALSAVLAVVAISSNLIFKPLPDIKDENDLFVVQHNIKLSPEFSMSSLTDLVFARLADKYTEKGEFSLYLLSAGALSHNEENVFLNAMRAAHNVFDVLGLGLIAGERPTADNLEQSVWISNALWRSQFNGNASVIGKGYQFDGQTKIIRGVVDDFYSYRQLQFDKTSNQVWSLFELNALLDKPLSGSFGTSWQALIRDENRQFNPTDIDDFWASLLAENDQLAAVLGRIIASNGAQSEVTPYRSAVMSGQNKTVVFVLVIVSILLLMVCVNLLNLFVSYSKQREQEVAIQMSLGATTRKLVAMLFLENLPVFLLSCLLGMLGAAWVIRLLPTLTGDTFEFLELVKLDGATFVIALLVVVVINGVFSRIAVSQFNPRKLVEALNHVTNKGMTNTKLTWMDRCLFVIQLSSASLVLLGASLLAVSAYNEFNVDLSIDIDDTYSVRVTYHDLGLNINLEAPDDSEGNKELVSIGTSIRATLEEAITTHFSDLTVMQGQDEPLGVDTRIYFFIDEDTKQQVTHASRAIGPDYLDTFDITLLAGRNVTQAEFDAKEQVVLVNESLANILTRGEAIETVLGKKFNDATVIGVVQDHYTLFHKHEGFPMSLTIQGSWFETGQTLTLRASKGARIDVEELTRVLTDSHETIKDVEVRDMSNAIAERNSDAILQFYTISVLIVVTLVSAAVGSYGMAVSFAQLKRFELAVRTTLGATRGLLMKRTFVDFSSTLLLSFFIACGLASALYGWVNQQSDLLPPLAWSELLVFNSILLGVVVLCVLQVIWTIVNANPMKVLKEQ